MRKRIMSAAVAEMDEHGVRFTMSDLAARLAISKRTLYDHCESKEVLISSIVDAVVSDLCVQRCDIVNNPDLDLREKLVRMLTIKSKVFSDVSDRVKMELSQQYPGLWKKLINRRKNSGILSIMSLKRVLRKAASGLYLSQCCARCCKAL